MPEIHESHTDLKWMDDTWLCHNCQVCLCHSPELLKKECRNA